MPRFCLLPYDSESDEEEVFTMMDESDTNQPAVGSNVNDGWMTASEENNSSAVGFTANCSWTKAKHNPGPWNDEQPTFLKKDAETQWKQWNNKNSIAFVGSLNSTLAQLNDSIQERIQIEQEKLAQQHKREIQELQILQENVEMMKIEPSQNDIQECRQEENSAVPMQAESASENKRVETTALPTPALSTMSSEKNTARKEYNAAKENIKICESKTISKADHVLKAENLLERLEDVQKSIEPFSKSKIASRQRLKMKRTICGKLNTLTDSPAKIKEVADEIKAAIQLARNEDAQSPNMAVSVMYLLDLCSSNIMTRVQGDGFNGPRGDGFPLAATIAQVAAEYDGIIPILEAHFYKVCPMAIPRFPDESLTNEEDLMLSLGMQQEKSGELESWDRFATRTENIIAMVANIQASKPVTNVLFGGHQGAADWLERFLESLPSTTPLPLLTAPVLYGFFSGVGHMLANMHDNLFRRSLQLLCNDILGRLDQGTIGKPSFIRLSKLLENGFDGFRRKLPSKAIPLLYNSSIGLNAKAASFQPPATLVAPVQLLVAVPPAAGLKLPSKPPTIAPIVAPISHENISEDVEMIDVFDDSEPVSTTILFPHFGTTTVMGNKNQQLSHSSSAATPFGFTAPSPMPNEFGFSFVPPANGLGFGAAQHQPRNPFETTQGQTMQLSFGQASSMVICQKTQPVSHQNTKNIGPPKSNTSTTKKKKSNNNNSSRKRAPPCKFFAMGKCKFGSNCKFSHETGDENTTLKQTKKKNRNKTVGRRQF